ncbi:MAG: hypothetical protein CMN32_06055 [Saprospirales bacterium]|nr:hypothetical protein [Saprospirales bacterium]
MRQPLHRPGAVWVGGVSAGEGGGGVITSFPLAPSQNFFGRSGAKPSRALPNFRYQYLMFKSFIFLTFRYFTGEGLRLLLRRNFNLI